MIILGIDPGSRRIGYGLIDASGSKPVLQGVGIFTITRNDNPGALAELRSQLQDLIRTARPTHLAIEKLFFTKNRTTGIAVAEARGVVLATAEEAKLKIHEYSPNEIKLALTGNGSADKQAMAKMVRLILPVAAGGGGIAVPAKLLDDATDALAIALVAAGRIPLSERIANGA